jgi:DNA repair exonuclease SbcCD nuclease subunit
MRFAEPVRLLCTADLHLGRYPSRIPIGKTELSVGFVWERIVEYAIQQKIDALVLAGDVVDHENRFFESYGPLERGLRRLAEAGIHTFAVAGNHDYDVLARLHQVLNPEFFHFLGRNGRWEEAALMRGGEPVLGFFGWSFTSRTERISPLDGVPEPRSDVPVIGLVHGDLNAKSSVYAPLSESDLKRVPVASWILGHIHLTSRIVHRAGFILYPGSPQPLDPGEAGDHGPYIVDVHPDGRVEMEQVVLASVKYATCDVDLGDVDGPEAFEGSVLEAIRDGCRREVDAHDGLRHVVYRPRYVGRTAVERDIERLHAHTQANLEISVGEVVATIDSFTAATTPAVDLDVISEAGGPLSELARMMLVLEEGEIDGELRPLVRDIMTSLERVARSSAYSALREHEYADDCGEMDLKMILRRQGMLLLDELMSQTRTGGS